MKRSNKLFGVGFILTIFGAAGLAEVITSDRGSFMFCTVVLSIGIACVLVSYTVK